MRFSFIDPIYDSDGIWYASKIDRLYGNELMRSSMLTHITNVTGDPRLMTQSYVFLAGRNTTDFTTGVAGAPGAGRGSVCYGHGGGKFLSHSLHFPDDFDLKYSYNSIKNSFNLKYIFSLKVKYLSLL